MMFVSMMLESMSRRNGKLLWLMFWGRPEITAKSPPEDDKSDSHSMGV